MILCTYVIIALLQGQPTSIKEKLIFQDLQSKNTRVGQQILWKSRATSPLPDLSPPSLSSKLASSLPTLHFQENIAPSQQSCAQSLLMTLGKPVSCKSKIIFSFILFKVKIKLSLLLLL